VQAERILGFWPPGRTATLEEILAGQEQHAQTTADRLVEPFARLPRDSQERVMDAVLALVEPSGLPPEAGDP